MRKLRPRAPQDGRVSIKRAGQSIDVRIAILPTTHGEKVTLRLVADLVSTVRLDSLGLWEESTTGTAPIARRSFTIS